jgi:hypothetical protein
LKLSAFLLLPIVALPVFGQQTQNTPTEQNNSGYFNPFTLASGMLERNFVNVFAYGNGAYDSNAQILSNGQTAGAPGYSVGGGIELSHVWKDAQLGLSYNGGYQHYNSNFFISGPTQNLTLGYTKRLGRRWSLSLTEGAGIYLYGETSYSSQATNTTPLVANPFAPEMKFASSSFGLTYQQTRRLSYTLGGYYSLYRYTGPGGIGAEDVGGSISANYRLTARTTVGASYSYSYFLYQRHAGNDHLNGFYGTLAHQFQNHWSASVSAGVARSSAVGTIQVPVTILTGQQQPLTGYVLGSYHDVSDIPSFSGTATHSYRRSQISINAGQGVSSGNGVFLASKNRFLGGIYSYNMRHSSVLSVAGYYNRLTSVANTVSTAYSSGTFTIGYGRNLFRYVAANVRYDYIEYGGVGSYGGAHDNHFTFGLSFSSKSIPLTLY